MTYSRHRHALLALLVIAYLAARYTPPAVAQVASWVNPSSGFYDTPSNWNPASVPAATDTLVFAQSGAYDVGLTGTHGAENLTLDNDADVRLNVAGPSTSTRLLRLTGDLSIDDAKLRLQGHPAGPRINMVLDGNIDILADENALQVIDNAALLNLSSLIDVDGEVSVRGTQAHWSMQSNMVVRGGALLSITDGATVVSQNVVTVGNPFSAPSTFGSVSVVGIGDDGAPSALDAGARLSVGRFGTSQFDVRDGGHVNAGGSLSVAVGAGSFANIVVDGADPAGNPSVLNTGVATLGAGGTADLSIQSGGQVNSESAIIGSQSLTMVELVGGDHGAEWNIAGNLWMSDGGFSQVVINEGAIVRSGDALLGIGNSDDPSAMFSLIGDPGGPTSLWENQGDAYRGGDDTGPGSFAVIRINENAAANIGGELTIWNQGELTLRSGGMLTADIVDHMNNGVFDFEGGTLSVNRFEGDLTNLGGSLAPGSESAAGATIVTEDYNQHSDGKLAIDVGGLSPGGTHDLVNVLGDASLDGLLELSLTNSFTPDASDVFTILAADTLTGFFDNINSGQRLDTADGLGSFVVNYGIGSAFDETRIVLSDFESSGLLPGDYNDDGVVDAADYTVWRNSLDAPAGTLLNDVDGGVIGAAQYETWKDNYGTTSGNGPANAVPEPMTLTLLALLGIMSLGRKRGSPASVWWRADILAR